jgi:ribosomal protein S18 acetylase RimI-like enzyme
MPLCIRPATASDHAGLEALVIDSFEPITWQKKLDENVGPLNGHNWRLRWQSRLRHIFRTQEVLVGEVAGELAAMASATVDLEAALGFIDVLAVGRAHQRQGLGREMLQGMLQHLQDLGCQYVHLDCLTDNATGNALYASEGFSEVARHIRWFRKL